MKKYLNKALLLPLLFMFTAKVSAQSPTNSQNYIITFTPRTPISDITQLAGKAVSQVNQTIQYVDGLGRPSQNVQWQASPAGRDVVQPIAYDGFGREVTKYLPYANAPWVSSDGSFKTDAVTQQSNFYN